MKHRQRLKKENVEGHTAFVSQIARESNQDKHDVGLLHTIAL